MKSALQVLTRAMGMGMGMGNKLCVVPPTRLHPGGVNHLQLHSHESQMQTLITYKADFTKITTRLLEYL